MNFNSCIKKVVAFISILFLFAALNPDIGSLAKAKTEKSLVGTVFLPKKLEYVITADAVGDIPGEVKLISFKSKKYDLLVLPETVDYEGKKYTLTALGDACFALKDIKQIEIPATVKSIGDGCFFGNSVMESFYIGANIEAIGTGAFSYCNALKEVKVAAENKFFSVYDNVIYSKKFKNLISAGAASGKVKLAEDTVNILPYAFEGNHKIAKVSCNPKLSVIGDNAFYDCRNLEYFKIPSKVKLFNDNPFKYCVSLKELKTDPSNKNYSSKNGVLYTKSGKTLVAYPGCEGEFIIPSEVKYIGDYAFMGADKLESLVLSVNVKTVGKGAFYDCRKLSSVYYESRKVILPSNAEIREDMVFGNTSDFIIFNLKYHSKEEGEFEEMLRLNAPSTVIFINR